MRRMKDPRKSIRQQQKTLRNAVNIPEVLELCHHQFEPPVSLDAHRNHMRMFEVAPRLLTDNAHMRVLCLSHLNVFPNFRTDFPPHQRRRPRNRPAALRERTEELRQTCCRRWFSEEFSGFSHRPIRGPPCLLIFVRSYVRAGHSTVKRKRPHYSWRRMALGRTGLGRL